MDRIHLHLREIKDMEVVRETFQEGIKSIRSVEEECLEQLRNGEKGREYFGENHKEVIEVVDQICGR